MKDKQEELFKREVRRFASNHGLTIAVSYGDEIKQQEQEE